VTATNNTGADLASGAALLSFYDRQHAGRCGRGDGKLHGDAGQRDGDGGQPNDHDEHYRRRHLGDQLSGPSTVAEGGTTSTYTVSLTNGIGLGAGQSVTFTLDSASGTATEGSDFSALLAAGLTGATNIALSNITTDANGTIHVTATNNTGADLASGAALLSFTIASTQDAVVEATENFTVTLGSATATVVNPTITTNIIDNDTSAITLSGPSTVAEGGTTSTYTVSLTNGIGLGAGQSVTFTLDSASGTATEGSDFSGRLCWRLD
jgi:hypothetical protein